METKTKQILEPSLGTLHGETRKWIEEIQFYMDELTFINDLVKSKIGSTTYESQERKDLYRNVDDMLEKLSKELVLGLKSHDAYLSKLLDLKQDVHDDEYRARHKTMAKKLESLKLGLRELKKSIFAFVRLNAIDR